MNREAVAPAALIALVRERLAATACADCVPIRLSPIKPVAGGINWQVLEHPSCSDPCVTMMLETCRALGERYDVDWQAADFPAHTPPVDDDPSRDPDEMPPR